MEILLIGNQGQLGWELERTLQPLGNILALARPQIDLIQLDSLRNLIRTHQPQVVINAAAYTAVDRAESEPELALKVNRDAPATDLAHNLLADFCHRVFGWIKIRRI